MGLPRETIEAGGNNWVDSACHALSLLHGADFLPLAHILSLEQLPKDPSFANTFPAGPRRASQTAARSVSLTEPTPPLLP